MDATRKVLFCIAAIALATAAQGNDRESLESATRAKIARFLEQQREIHGAEAIAELKETKAEIGDDGTSHFRFDQIHGGVPVLFAGAIVHTIKGNAPVGQVKVFRGLNGVPTTPSLTLEQAVAIAANKLGIRWTMTVDERLVIVARRTIDDDLPKQNVLAWDFLIAPEEGTATVRTHRFIINAVTGEILRAEDATMHASPSNTWHGATPRIRPYFGPTSGYYDWTGVRTMCTTQKCKSYAYQFDKFYLEDPCFGLGFAVTPQIFGWGSLYCAAGPPDKSGFVPAYRGGNYVCDRGNFLSTCVPFEWSTWDPDRFNFGDGTPGSTDVKTLVADAYVSRLTFEYMHRVLQRQGLDGMNGPRVRVETRSPDISGGGAYWDRALNRIVVGPGDASTFHWATPDVIAHEIGHGLDDYGPKIQVSGTCPESNKLKEATADMFAMLASRTTDSYGLAWQMVEQPYKTNWSGMTFTPTVSDRYLQNPPAHTGYPACYDSTIVCMEPHRGSSPAGHMFYLLMYGGTSACNGVVLAPAPSLDVARLWSLAFFKYMVSPTPLTYADMKNAFVFAALEMDGGAPGAVSARVQDAFAAINM